MNNVQLVSSGLSIQQATSEKLLWNKIIVENHWFVIKAAKKDEIRLFMLKRSFLPYYKLLFICLYNQSLHFTV